MSKRELKVVRLLEPELCTRCRFADIADVEMADGRVQRMLYCRRLDCDNWDYGSAEPAKRVELSKGSEDWDDVVHEALCCGTPRRGDSGWSDFACLYLLLQSATCEAGRRSRSARRCGESTKRGVDSPSVSSRRTSRLFIPPTHAPYTHSAGNAHFPALPI
jgi:hypothetical protein